MQQYSLALRSLSHLIVLILEYVAHSIRLKDKELHYKLDKAHRNYY